MDKQKLKQFQRLAGEYQKRVAKIYDEENKGSYFHYEWKTNEDKKGVTWENGGETLINTGRDIISKAMILYAPEFRALYTKSNEIRKSMDFEATCRYFCSPVHS